MEYASDEARRLVQTVRGCHHGRTWAVYCRDCEIVGLRQTYADSIRRARNAERRLLAMGEAGNPPDVRADVRAADEIERLRAELAEAKRDAERYRWLRSDDCPFSCYEQEGPDNWGWCPTSSRDLDEAIDAAMVGGEHG